MPCNTGCVSKLSGQRADETNETESVQEGTAEEEVELMAVATEEINTRTTTHAAVDSVEV